MKPLLTTILASLVLLTGCLTPVQKQLTCDTAKAAYQTYITIMNAGGEPSQDQIIAAAAAGVFLTLYCGWTTPSPGPARGAYPPVDIHGVIKACPKE